ncbi:6,7-dimethyl-8-ribityllumazine synthase, partial [Flavobacteriaceae bacterium]|nr:6,7-dimethyl-8-ribityllumazine synthase [Flavobacteriaceae bacterium]
FVCQAVSQGVKDLNVLSKVPVVFCVLTDNTLEQAQDRSGGKHGNKGVEAAVAAMQMIALRKVP